MTAPTATTTQAALETVAAAAAADLATALGRLDVGDLSGTLTPFAALVAAIVDRYGKAASALSVQQYLAARRIFGITSRFTAMPAKPVPLQQVGSVVSWATQPLWAQNSAVEAAERNLEAGVKKLVLDQGRHTIIDNVHRDPKAHGWARVTETRPCSFCALLATRGAVYRSDRTASFKSHDHCACHAEPTFGPYEPPARVREWQQLYRDSTRGNAVQVRRQWRQAFNATYGTTK